MKRILTTLLCLLSIVSIMADEVFTQGSWKVTLVETDGTIKVHHLKADGTYRPVFIGSAAEAAYDNPKGTGRVVTVTDFAHHDATMADVADPTFGPARQLDIAYSKPSNGDDVTMTLHLLFPDGHPYMLTSLTLACDQPIRSNYLAPIYTSKTIVFLTESDHNRMLKVPFDNDSFIRYQRYPLTTSLTSYEATAIYEGDSRNGLIAGAVDHDHWKNGILASAEKTNRLKSFRLQSGISTNETHDVLPHGKLVGTTISSARFFVDFVDDWRLGMEQYTAACRLVVPRRDNWPYGNPVGWMSWNVLEAKNNYSDDLETMRFICEELRPAGFHNGQAAPNVISIDAWSNLSESQERLLCKEAESLGAVVGCYGNPFCLWWGDGDLDKNFYTSSLSRYTGREVVLKANGQPIKYDGAFCLDPTHPAVKASCANWIISQYKKGFRYFKLDFTTCGIIQADSYYNPDVHTAVEAYNEGFTYYCKKVDELPEPVFLTLSISPLFPYQYANARRIACDTWGTINWSEYSMNALSAGWWTDGLYQYNDPDGLPMVGKGDQLYCSMGENRARITNGIAAGMVLMADNFSTGNASGNGNPELSRTRAKTLLCNPDVNAMLAIGRSFYPVYGYDEYQGHSDSAESFAMYRTDSCLYVSVINYGTTDMAGTVPFERLGLDTSVTPVSCIKELWKGDVTDTCSPTSQPDALSYSVPAKDARIYRITLADDTSIRRPFSDGAAGCSDEGTDVFDLLGRPMTDTSAPHGTLTITRQRATDGTARTTKQLK